MKIDKSFLEKYLLFVNESLQWCIKESENSTNLITDSIKVILEDTQRVTILSTDSIEAINSIKGKLTKQSEQKENKKAIKEILSTLQKINTEHEELGDIIDPIINSLQYQDKFIQNLESLKKIADFWKESRFSAVENHIDISADLDKFGQALCHLVATPKEREIILKNIPNCTYKNEFTEKKVSFF